MPNTDNRFYVFDFDSTLISVESLDLLAELSSTPETAEKIKKITELGMKGKISFEDSLAQRLSHLKINQGQIGWLINILKTKISVSVIRNISFFRDHSSNIFVITGGFEEYAIPVLDQIYIKPNNIIANKFLWNGYREVTGFDPTCPTSKNGGKSLALNSLKLKGEIFVIGDGSTDLEMKNCTHVAGFCAFVENIRRENIVSKADYVFSSIDDLIREIG